MWQARIVQLVHVNIIGLQALETVFKGLAHKRRSEVVRNFLLSYSLITIGIVIVTKLGRDHDTVALTGECRC